MTVRRRPRHPALAAALSFLFPGLGQAYTGQRTMALLLAVPMLLLISAAIVAAALFGGQLRNQLLSQTFLAGILALDIAVLGWRLFAIGHAGFARLRYPAGSVLPAQASVARRGLSIGLVVILLAATVGMHTYAALLIGRLDDTLTRVFGDGTRRPGSAAGPLNVPEYRWNGTERINFLLLGIDSGPGRTEALTDTILVVSIDPVKKRAVMVSVPRDTGFMPLPDRRIYADGVYPQKINALATEAGLNAGAWCPDLPAGTDCGLRTLERSVGLYLGIRIQYYARVNLEGFAKLIDSLGGVELCLPGVLTDPEYSGPTWYPKYGITLSAGCARYDGAHALAYARIRKGTLTLPNGTVEPQNDFTRADRQQKVLLALREKLAQANLVFALPGILDAVGQTVSTDFPRAAAGDLASLLPLITGPEITRVVLGLPQYVDPPVDPVANYLLIPKRDAVRAEAQRLFGADGPLKGWYVGSTASAPPAVSASPSGSAGP